MAEGQGQGIGRESVPISGTDDWTPELAMRFVAHIKLPVSAKRYVGELDQRLPQALFTYVPVAELVDMHGRDCGAIFEVKGLLASQNVGSGTSGAR